jgi:dTDP-4-dehydrorhamnose reductase
MKRPLITGGSGKLGTALKSIFPDGLFPAKKELDITNQNQVENYLLGKKPSVIIHAAAITDIRMCDEKRNLAWNVNVKGTQNLIRTIVENNMSPYFIYLSSPCVFDGKSSFYKESDIPNPKNFYALTKFASEIIIQNSGIKNWLIIRTNFVEKSTWPYPFAFTDRFGTYLFTEDVAKGIKELIDAKMEGIIHLTGDRKLSMYELAKKITPNIKPITMKQYQGPELTINMALKSTKWKSYKISSFK